jgi:hypothetical protein
VLHRGHNLELGAATAAARAEDGEDLAPEAKRAGLARPVAFAEFFAKNMSVPHSSSMDRSTWPPLPMTNPTQSSGTCTMDMSSRFMVGSMCTGPTRCVSTNLT